MSEIEHQHISVLVEKSPLGNIAVIKVPGEPTSRRYSLSGQRDEIRELAYSFDLCGDCQQTLEKALSLR